MYAIFETGGKQYKAEKGDVVFVEKLAAEAGKSVIFDALVVADGDDVKIGTPTVNGAKVRAKVVEHGKAEKVIVFKYKPKRKYRKKQGHRQPFTKIQVTSIALAKEPGEKETPKTAAKAAPKTTAKAAPKTAAKAAPKTAAKAAPKTAAKAAPKTAAKAAPKTTAKAAPKTTAKAAPKKTTAKAAPKKTAEKKEDK